MTLFLPWFNRLLKLLGASLVLAACCLSWVFGLSPRARAGRLNQKNAQRLQLGMNRQQAIAIMGPPDKKMANPFAATDSIYAYQPAVLAASEVSFAVGPAATVTHISHGE